MCHDAVSIGPRVVRLRAGDPDKQPRTTRVRTMGEVKTFLVLLRGINVGGKNKVAMAELRSCLEGLGFSDVATFIVSGNVVLASERTADEIAAQIEAALPEAFKLDSELIRVLVLPHDRLQAVVDDRPKGFGDQPDKYHSDV